MITQCLHLPIGFHNTLADTPTLLQPGTIDLAILNMTEAKRSSFRL
jgi:hypothetical protein